jgi:hypothetical protein
MNPLSFSFLQTKNKMQNDFAELIVQVSSPRRGVRRDAAAEIAQLFSDFDLSDSLSHEELRSILIALLNAEQIERKQDVRDEIIHAISWVATICDMTAIDFSDLGRKLTELSPTATYHAIGILAANKDNRYSDYVRPYLKSSDADIRQAALDYFKVVA